MSLKKAIVGGTFAGGIVTSVISYAMLALAADGKSEGGNAGVALKAAEWYTGEAGVLNLVLTVFCIIFMGAAGGLSWYLYQERGRWAKEREQLLEAAEKHEKNLIKTHCDEKEETAKERVVEAQKAADEIKKLTEKLDAQVMALNTAMNTRHESFRTDIKDMFAGVTAIANRMSNISETIIKAIGDQTTQTARMVDRIDNLRLRSNN